MHLLKNTCSAAALALMAAVQVGCDGSSPAPVSPDGPRPDLGPALIVPDAGGMGVWWHLPAECEEHVVRYGLEGALDLERKLSLRTATPFVRIDSLEPGRRYSYRVRSGEYASDVRTFALPRTDGTFRLAVWADNQGGTAVFAGQTLPAIARRRPDLLLGLGDFVQRGERAEDWAAQFYLPAAELLGAVPLFPARGNHDGEGALARAMLPLPADLGWYALSLGPLRLVVLDTNLVCEDGSPQLEWLRQESAGAAWRAAKCRIVGFHHAPFTVLWDQPGYDGELPVRSTVVPVLEERGADIVLSGHAHAYERFRRRRPDGNEIQYLVLGGGGGALDRVRTGDWTPAVQVRQVHHIAMVEVSPDRIELLVVDTATDRPIDRLHLDGPAPGGGMPRIAPSP